jgi:hypothetical protein
MSWACSTHEKIRIEYKIFIAEPENKKPQGALCADGIIILKWTLQKYRLNA